MAQLPVSLERALLEGARILQGRLEARPPAGLEQHAPREGGTLIAGPTGFTFTRVEETIEASSNKVFSVSYDTATPVLGGTLAMTVTGDLGQAGGDSVLFTPDTFNTWQPGLVTFRPVFRSRVGYRKHTCTPPSASTKPLKPVKSIST